MSSRPSPLDFLTGSLETELAAIRQLVLLFENSEAASAEGDRLKRVVEAAGFRDITLEVVTSPMRIGDADDTAGS